MFGMPRNRIHHYSICTLLHVRLSITKLILCSIDPLFHGDQCTLASPHSNAVVDLDGDCLAGNCINSPSASTAHRPSIDVFLLCDDGNGGKTYQVWVNNKADGFSLALQGAMPSGVQTVSFADVGTLHCYIVLNSMPYF